MTSPALVVRFSSLGDVVLAGAVTGPLAPVVFVTQERYREVASLLPGVSEVVTARPGEGPGSIARRLPPARLQVDLHGSLRSRALALARGGVWRRVEKATIRRHLRVALKWGPPPPVVERYALAATVDPVPLPWMEGLWRRPGGDVLLLLPGSAHATKRWPAEGWRALAARWSGPVRVLGGPGEEGLCAEIAAAAGRGEAVCGEGFQQALSCLSGAMVAVGTDSGLSHLCAAAGLPVLVIFGSTTSSDGFWGGRCRSVELPLSCRPCSRYGGSRCPVGDHLCMEGLSPDVVWDAIQEVLR